MDLPLIPNLEELLQDDAKRLRLVCYILSCSRHQDFIAVNCVECKERRGFPVMAQGFGSGPISFEYAVQVLQQLQLINDVELREIIEESPVQKVRIKRFSAKNVGVVLTAAGVLGLTGWVALRSGRVVLQFIRSSIAKKKS